MPGLTPRDMNGYGGYDRGMANGYDPYGEREEYSREEDIYRKVVRNGRGTNDRFQNEYYPDQGSMADFNTNEPTYELDHLASFDAGRGNSSMSAEDGLQKLKQMENSPGIWTMRCIMIIERRFVVVLDKSTGEELERFPVQLINEPTAIMKTDRREIYHNLVLFTVLEDPKRRNGSIDMHIFHSIKNPAREIVDEMLAAKSGQTRISSGPRSTNIHPADLPGPSRDSMFLRMTEYPESRHVGGQGRLARPPFLREDYEAGQNEVLEKDVQLLNHCFDDIEKFVARLQQAAESYKELEKRKKERGNKSKKKQAGDGMLSLRARPPPSSDFVDIFQKFKLSFNLLAKLKSHIHNPNAIELVHFLFTPLSLIVEASRDPVHGNQNLAERAISPAISHDAKHLLVNCLTSKETEFWESLGRNWTTSKEEYKGFIPPYAPRFYDGWQPALSVVEDNPQVPLEYAVQAHADQIYNRAREQEARHRAAQMVMPFPAEEDRRYGRVDEYRRDYESRPSPRAPTPPPGHGMKNPAVGGYQEYVEKHIESSHYDRNFVANESSSRRLPERPMAPSPRQQPQEDDNVVYAREIRRTGGRVCEVMHDRVGKNEKELTVNKGEVLRVVDSSRKWWKVRNAKGEIGYAPYTILQEKDEGPEERDTGTPQDRMSGAYNSYIPNEQALAPPAPPPAPAVDSGMGRRAKRDYGDHTDVMDDAPPPLPDRPVQLSAPQFQHSPNSDSSYLSSSSAGNNKKKKERTQLDDLQDELKAKMCIRNPPKAPPKYSSGPSYITQQSTPEEVSDWLEAKGFSPICVQTFSGYNGADMFHLAPREMDRLIGREESARLESHLTVQKSMSGFGTRGGSELKAILHRRKQQADTASSEEAAMGQPPSFRPNTPQSYEDYDSDDSIDQLADTGKTLRDLLLRQRKKIMSNAFNNPEPDQLSGM